MNRYYAPLIDGVVQAAVIYSDAIKSKPDTLTPTSTNEEIVAAGFVKVEQPAYPNNGKDHIPGVPMLEGDKYVGVWVEQESPAYEMRKAIRERSARKDRDSLLAACDWTQVPDSPLSAEKRTAWGVYRQNLRDVPKQANFPFTIQWPQKPE
jgi:hypothetical protein